ncbi:hypothetical protein [Nonomuraea monospora]|uniref:hypothetical protein n=1 Tax=Nonomuraea monospora TaxID=568818 RepID=UPI003CD06FD7
MLKAAGVTRVFAEKISTRATVRPGLGRPSPWPGNRARRAWRSPSWCTSTSGSAAASTWPPSPSN